MRKVSETVVKAFLAGKEKRVGNTYTNGNALFLHGNMIAYKKGLEMNVSTAGWGTVTTRDRLNCLFSFLSSFGYEVHVKRAFQKDFVTYFAMENGLRLHGSNWVVAGTLQETAKVG